MTLFDMRMQRYSHEYRVSMIVGGWAYRRGDWLLAEQCYSSAMTHALRTISSQFSGSHTAKKRFLAARRLQVLAIKKRRSSTTA